MQYFSKLLDCLNVAPLVEQLDNHPELWDQVTFRKDDSGSPHLAMQDIWIRYNDLSKFPKPIDRQALNSLHMPVWYPGWYALPALRPIIFGLMAHVQAVHLGAILITKLPAGGEIKTHVDSGWHAEYHNCKLYIPIKSDRSCINRSGDQEVAMLPGEVWTFNNLVPHSVRNHGTKERINLIVCMRVE